MPAPKVNVNIKNLVQNVSTPLSGIFFVSARTERGPVSDPSDIVGSWSQFQKIFGGIIADNNDALVCKVMLERGAKLRVNRMVHYTDPTDASTTTAVKANVNEGILLTFSADLVASNTINMTVNSVAIAEVTYASSSNNTMGLIAAAIGAMDGVQYAETVTPASGNIRQILVLPDSTTDLVIASAAVTNGASQATITQADKGHIVDNRGNILFNVAAKNHGADYNNIEIEISDASNANSAYFDMTVTHTGDTTLTESYTNLTITGQPNIAASSFLDAVMNATQLLTFSYVDLSALTGTLRPLNGVYYFENGDDGDAVVDADWIGDSGAKTGFYAFDTYDDTYAITTAHEPSNAVLVAGSAYTAARKDMVYIAHLANSYTTDTTLATARGTTAIDNPYCYICAGGIKVTHPQTSASVSLPETPQVIAAIAYTQAIAFPFYSFAGTNRGLMPGILGVVNNFGTPGMSSNLDNLINRQINAAVVADGRAYIVGNYSAQLADTPMKFMNIVMLILYIKKALQPMLRNYLEEPNLPKTWKAIYFNVKPFLDSLVTNGALEYDGYRWNGDQDAASSDDYQVNNATDVSNGKYVINFMIKPVASLQEINMNIVLTPSSVSFETASGLL